jgi:hypothetical protein
MHLFLSTRNIKQIFDENGLNTDKAFHLDYDIPSWLKNTGVPLMLEDFYKQSDYIVKLTKGTKANIKDAIKMNKDFELSLQILYRDGTIRNFWPLWIRQNIAKNEKAL